MKKKKLLIFHPALAPYRVDQFNALNELFDLEVVFLFDNLWNYKMDQSKLLSQSLFRVSFLLKGPHYKGRVFRFGILKMINKINPDMILSYEYSFTTQYLILLKRLRLISQKIGSTIDDSMDICNHVQSKIRFQARQQSVKYLDFMVVMSAEVSQFYQGTFNFKGHQIIVSPILQSPKRLRSNSDELEEISQKYMERYNLKNKKVLLFVGRFVPEKALPGFLNTIYSILLDQEHLVFVLVGEGKEIQSLRGIIEEKHLDGKVIFPGKYEGKELNAWYLCASGFVLPSTYEPFGAVVNEALIFGLKVLCSQYAGASSLIHAGNGIIFNPLDKMDVIEKINLFLNIIDTVENVNLLTKPSLIANYQQEFIDEWSKLLYE